MRPVAMVRQRLLSKQKTKHAHQRCDDNAKLHTPALIRNKLEEMVQKILEHPPYSPDLSLCDYFLFAPRKESLEGRRFGSTEEVQEQVRKCLTTHSQTYYAHGILKLLNRWQNCVDHAIACDILKYVKIMIWV